MLFFQMLRGRESPVIRTEPQAILTDDASNGASADTLEADNDLLAMLGEHYADDDLRGSDAIFSFIGSRPALEQGAASQSPTRFDADDLISSLHRQYCQALDNPFGLGSVAEWEAPAEPAGHDAHGGSGLPVDPHLHRTGHDSIEALLTGAQLLDHAFGALKESDLGYLPESESAPEILRLFAPPEYQASGLRSRAMLPPALARREHHSLGIDSPLPMPQVNLTEDSE
ncbi:TagK domain-containing protein [Paraburkholderia sp.]|uniref:TagK domain-containing protein n=1 Tax=Paraburkholderia sp. TaxID=1926495 RepID=UPI00286F18D2|nr:TagK domain-containing protein [Paraburkholderia sp.]